MNRPDSLQVSCVQMHWARSLDFNLQRTLHYIGAAAAAGSRVVLFPEANLTSYYFPQVIQLDPAAVAEALRQTCAAARQHGIWVIAGTLRRTADRHLNLAHVRRLVHRRARRHPAGRGRVFSGGDDHRRPGSDPRRPLVHQGLARASALPRPVLDPDGR